MVNISSLSLEPNNNESFFELIKKNGQDDLKINFPLMYNHAYFKNLQLYRIAHSKQTLGFVSITKANPNFPEELKNKDFVNVFVFNGFRKNGIYIHILKNIESLTNRSQLYIAVNKKKDWLIKSISRFLESIDISDQYYFYYLNTK